MNEYKKYNEIENVERKLFLDKIKEQGHSGGTWNVTEKTHGANFSICYDGKNFYCGKRSGWITDEDGSFYNYTSVRDKYKEKIIDLYNHLNNDYIILYGELIGGNYPHNEVEKVKNSIKIQSGIYYSPDNDFYVYDIVLNDKYIPYDVAVKLLEKFNFLYAAPLMTGSLEECLAYKNEFQTTIPEKLGLPPIENNLCEGVVIKPNETRFMGHSRVILKNKNEKWSENNKKRKNKSNEKHKFTKEGQELLDILITFVSENRLRNVLSKEGRIDNKMFGYVMKKFTEDIMKDFIKDHQHSFDLLNKEERKLIQKRMSTEASNVLRENFLNIIDGIFV